MFSIEWWKAAGVRAIKTAAQTAIATIGTSAAFIHEVDWLMVASAAALGGVLSLITSIAGLPELKEEQDAKHAKHFEDEE
jgi:hypothetical protein